MEINVGDYIRTKCGIAKLNRIDNGYQYFLDSDIYDKDTLENTCVTYIEYITKHSKDITDLIEDEDQIKFIINGDKYYGTVETELCFSKPLKGIWFNKEFTELKDLQIINVLTHEQFEANAYIIEKER